MALLTLDEEQEISFIPFHLEVSSQLLAIYVLQATLRAILLEDGMGQGTGELIDSCESDHCHSLWERAST